MLSAKKEIPGHEFLAKNVGTFLGGGGIFEEARELCGIIHPMNATSNFHTWLTSLMNASKVKSSLTSHSKSWDLSGICYFRGSTVMRFHKSFTHSEASLLSTSGQFEKWRLLRFPPHFGQMIEARTQFCINQSSLLLWNYAAAGINCAAPSWSHQEWTRIYHFFHIPFCKNPLLCLNLKGNIGEYAFCFVRAFFQKYAMIILQSLFEAFWPIFSRKVFR